MLKKSLLAISMLTLAGCNTMAVNHSADNDAPEYLDAYLCYAITDYNKETLISSLITSLDNPDEGFVTLSDNILYSAYHQYKGLERRWDFDCDENGCDYAIVLKPTGTANYFDFSESVRGESVDASYVLDCQTNEDFTRALNEGYIERHYEDLEREEYKEVNNKYEI